MESSSLTLIVLSGPTAGASYALEGAMGHVVMGSDPSANIQFEGSSGVVANHVRIVIDESGVGVEPASEGAVVYLNDDRIDAHTAIKNGDILWMGNPGDEGAVMIQCQLGPARDVTVDADAPLEEPPPVPPPFPEAIPEAATPDETPFYMPGEEASAPAPAEPSFDAGPEASAPEEPIEPAPAEEPLTAEAESTVEPEDDSDELGFDASPEAPEFEGDASMAAAEDQEPSAFIEPEEGLTSSVDEGELAAGPEDEEPSVPEEPEGAFVPTDAGMPGEEVGEEPPAFISAEDEGEPAEAVEPEPTAALTPEEIAAASEDAAFAAAEPEEPFVEAEPVEDEDQAAYGEGETLAFTGTTPAFEASGAPPEPIGEDQTQLAENAWRWSKLERPRSALRFWSFWATTAPPPPKVETLSMDLAQA